MVPHLKIIVYGQDKTLLDTRAWVLQTAGFNARTATDLHEIESLSASSGVELLVLCHTLTSVQVSEAVELSRDERSNIKHLLFVQGSTTRPFETSGSTVDPLAGPQMFIESVLALLTA